MRSLSRYGLRLQGICHGVAKIFTTFVQGTIGVVEQVQQHESLELQLPAEEK